MGLDTFVRALDETYEFYLKVCKSQLKNLVSHQKFSHL